MPVYSLTPDTLNFTVNIQQNNASERHSHDFIECMMIQSGVIHHTTEAGSENLVQGDLVLIMPGMVHAYHTIVPSSHYDVMIRTSFFQTICDFLHNGLFDYFMNQRILKRSAAVEIFPFLEHQVHDWQETIDITTKKTLEKITVSHLIGLFLPKRTENRNASSFRCVCLRVVNQYYSLPNAMQLIREELGYNENYLCKKFKQCFGCTLGEYITDLRLNYAVYMLQNMDISVSECISKIGLTSLPYFNKIFRNKYGMTPSDFKKQYGCHDSCGSSC